MVVSKKCITLAALVPARVMYRPSGLEVISTPTQTMVEWAVARDPGHNEVKTQQDEYDFRQTQ